MTDEKRSSWRQAYRTSPDVVLGRFVPESEADKLRERVKKFEDAAKVILEFDDGEAFEDWNLEPLQVLKAAIKNLREAMEGENENNTK